MTTSTAALHDGIQAINATVPGILWAPFAAEMPKELPLDRLPCIIPVPGVGTFVGRGMGGAVRQQRTWHLTVYLARADAADVGAVFVRGLDLLDQVGQIWRDQDRVLGAVIVRRSPNDVNDLGMRRTVTYNASAYYGFETRVTLLEPGV